MQNSIGGCTRFAPFRLSASAFSARELFASSETARTGVSVLPLPSMRLGWSFVVKSVTVFPLGIPRHFRGLHASLLFCPCLSGVAAALFFSGGSASQRNDGAAMAAHHIRDYLDRAALLFQFGADSGDEAVRSQGADQDLSGPDVAGDGLVSLLGICDRAGGVALFHDSSGFRCKACG